MIIEIFNLMKTIANSHNMINSFNYGDKFAIDKTGEAIHPEFYLEDTFNISNNESNEGVVNVSFAYYISDIPEQGQQDDISLTNKIAIINDDILAFLQLKQFAEFNRLLNWNSITMKEWQGDNCVVIRTELTLVVDRTSNNCLSPFQFEKIITI